MTDRKFAVGDKVKCRAEFLCYVGWFTGVPPWGIVRDVLGADPAMVRVQWCDSPDAILVLERNLMPFEALG